MKLSGLIQVRHRGEGERASGKEKEESRKLSPYASDSDCPFCPLRWAAGGDDMTATERKRGRDLRGQQVFLRAEEPPLLSDTFQCAARAEEVTLPV
ncbi:hypothetical protein AAFF_G00188160 [Aldrovandia affinis]|uniref:Uncharacterized protein n=1 Tax=Aldrovandia affinis TaxID=143900 RepID=A0AAD7SXZ2_9TELE|nr:hypothetical protein AAFF_G00188160 [Aldrovandia affinis]